MSKFASWAINCYDTLESCVQYNDITWVPWGLKSPATRLFVQQVIELKLTRKKTSTPTITAPLWLLDCPHKGPVIRKAFPCHDLVMASYHCTKLFSASYFLVFFLPNTYQINASSDRVHTMVSFKQINAFSIWMQCGVYVEIHGTKFINKRVWNICHWVWACVSYCVKLLDPDGFK